MITVALAAVVLPTATGTQPAAAATVLPTQFIAKQYTELLGRAPTSTEWAQRVSFYQGAMRRNASLSWPPVVRFGVLPPPYDCC